MTPEERKKKAAEVDRILEDAGITEEQPEETVTTTVVAPLLRDVPR